MSQDQDQTVTDNRPTIETERLVLRPFVAADAETVHEICSEKEIAANTRNIPHPYPEGAAIAWINQHPRMWKEGKSAIFAICAKLPDADAVSSDSNTVKASAPIGAIGLEICELDQNAEMGYWLAKSAWGNGFCTEAAARVLNYAFDNLALERVHAHYMVRNPASGRVLTKIGMKNEGVLRNHVRKWGKFEDIQFCGVLRSDPRDC